LSIPQESSKVLFETTLEPAGSVVDKLLRKEEIGEAEIENIRGKINKVSIGEPYYENIISRFTEENKDIPHEIKQMINDYGFHFVSLCCSFLPDNRCKFVWARFGVELNAASKETSKQLEERPIAYDMSPDEILSNIAYKKSISLSPKLKLGLTPVETDVELGKIDTQKEFIIYEPQIFAFGLRSPSIAWEFKSTSEKGIWGNKRNLLLLVKTPKNSRVKGRFVFGAEVEVNIGKLVRIAYKRKKDRIIDKEYDLSA
ncbi:unnamed protein product, partial [marine sediment metagenome]